MTLAKIPERAGICANDQGRQKKNAGKWGTKLHLGEIRGSITRHTWSGTDSLNGNGTQGPEGLEGFDSGSNRDDQESVWDVDPSLKGPPAAHGCV